MSRPGKPAGLVRRAETKADRQARMAAESAMTPEKELPKEPPAALKDHARAAKQWRKVVRMYGQMEARIVNGLDFDLLMDYCLLIEQAEEIDELRSAAMDGMKLLRDAMKRLQAEGKEAEALELGLQMGEAVKTITSLDARADRKRAHLHKLRESLYLTPRARAGASPTKRPKEAEPDAFEELLNEVTEFVNGDNQ